MIKKQALNPKRMFYIMIGGVLLIGGLGIGGVFVGTNFLQRQTDSLVALKLQYRIPEENQSALKQAKADIDKYSELGKTARGNFWD